MRFPERRRPAHPPIVEREERIGIVFVTVCTRRRKPILAAPANVATLIAAWRVADAWSIGRYVVLPDHLHLFCAPAGSETDVVRWVQYWKSVATRCWPAPGQRPLWQSGCWDTQLRSGDDYEDRWEYVRANPVRHGLASRPEDWPYQGELTVLDW